MHRKIALGGVAAAALLVLAACNQETATTTTDTNPQTAATEPVPGSNNEAVSAAQDAVGGAVGAVNAQLTMTTSGFVEAVAASDMYEVMAGEIAATRAKSPDLKNFAEDMIEAHTQTTNQLKSILAKSAPDIMPPAELPSRHQGMIDNLKGASDEDFDGRYIAQQLDAHNEALILMRSYAESGDNADIKAFAAATQPKVEMHLNMIEDIDRRHRANDAQVKDSGTTNKGTTTR